MPIFKPDTPNTSGKSEKEALQSVPSEGETAVKTNSQHTPPTPADSIADNIYGGSSGDSPHTSSHDPVYSTSGKASCSDKTSYDVPNGASDSASGDSPAQNDYLRKPVKKEAPLVWVSHSSTGENEQNQHPITSSSQQKSIHGTAQPVTDESTAKPSTSGDTTMESGLAEQTGINAQGAAQPVGKPLFPVEDDPQSNVTPQHGASPDTEAQTPPADPSAFVPGEQLPLPADTPAPQAENQPSGSSQTAVPAESHFSDGEDHASPFAENGSTEHPATNDKADLNGEGQTAKPVKADDQAEEQDAAPANPSSAETAASTAVPLAGSGGGGSGNGGNDDGDGGSVGNGDNGTGDDQNDQIDEDDEEYENEEENGEDEEDEANGPTTLREHLLELRKRVFNMFLWVIVGFAICYPFATLIFEFLMSPMMEAMTEAMKNVVPAQPAETANAHMAPLLEAMNNAMNGASPSQLADTYAFLIEPMLEMMLNLQHSSPAAPTPTLIFTVPSEAFFTEMKVAFVAGLFIMSPMVFYQIWRFVAPGLYREEKIVLLPLAFFSGFFFVSGAAFCYYAAFPVMFKFFMSYNSASITAMPSLKESLSFVLQILIAFGVVFELPLFTFFLARLGLVTGKIMRAFWRYAIIIILIVAAVLTPPDIFSQSLMAGPMLALYGLSIIIAEVFGKKTGSNDGETEEEETDGENEAGSDGQTV